MKSSQMGDSLQGSRLSRSSEATSVTNAKKLSKGSLVASRSRPFSQNPFGHMASVSHGIFGSGAVGSTAFFLLKVAALETVRRFSMAKCPFAWRGLQSLQVLCYPPFKWLLRWAPFKHLVEGMQILSRPILVLSIATVFSDEEQCRSGTSDGVHDSHSCSEPPPELSSVESTADVRTSEGSPKSLVSENWLVQLHKELENQGISLPERINEDELHRFYSAANGDFTCLLSSIKKTIRWRETYRILSAEELEMWSDMVFWHGFDFKHQPCLIVRLGLACVTLQSHEKPRFAQAIISQVEHGILHLVGEENSHITVLVDCEGLSPLKVPMKMMRSCTTLFQDHFPYRLSCLFVIRLPPVVRVIAQTFIQVLKPVTRKKLKIEGQMYKKVLAEYLPTLPSYLGGKCTCDKCSTIKIGYMRQPPKKRLNRIDPVEVGTDSEDPPAPYLVDEIDINLNANCDQALRTAIISILMLWVFIAVVAGFYDPESRPFFPPSN